VELQYVPAVAPPEPSVPSSRITVVFLLYQAAHVVPALVEGLARQGRAGQPNQSDWLEALWMDDASTDGTAKAVEASLLAIGSPSNHRLVVNPVNLGLAGTLNKALGLVRTPYVLTCHLDCRFGSDDYVASMLDLIDRHPEAAAITGQPTVSLEAAAGLAEKLNIVTNLMDIFPIDAADELVPVGFAEGRCDVFRVEALRAVGFYDTHLRVAGEDQVLAARLRERGYEIYQAPRLGYALSVSGEQDTVWKLLRHQRLFGRVHPYLMIRVHGTRSGIVGHQAGANRVARALLRVTQVAASAVYLLVVVALLAGAPAWLWAGALGLVFLAKAVLFGRHLRAVRLGPAELVAFLLAQPALDLSYTVGLAQGLWYVVRGDAHGPIR
jgi:cellulose synthase/poly-beta-1,6-N-acetylglucosamine synthase-like glycosyltransferase